MRNDTARLASLGIRINNVNPGPTITGLFTHGCNNNFELDVGQSVYEKLSRNSVLPGGAEPWEISRTILFLADEQSKSITGASYYIDRGISTYAPA
jgi:NAD(P)-dependent dehydrogenase (short-subunit alcohol dehydrogenase family)